MEAFKSGQVIYVYVWRGGERKQINVTELVIGDVVEINFGEKTPADIRVFESYGLKVDNSPLNGETKPVSIGKDPGEKGLTDAMEATNMMFYSTLIKEVNNKYNLFIMEKYNIMKLIFSSRFYLKKIKIDLFYFS